MKSEIDGIVDFSKIRYAQCWEDADVLLPALGDIRGKEILSIGSAGDNSLAILTRNPKKVIAVDMSASQIACIELKKAMYRNLKYDDMLAFAGIRSCENRMEIYQSFRDQLPAETAQFWDTNQNSLKKGFFHTGKFEHYFHLFYLLLRLIHTETTIASLVAEKSKSEREVFYDKKWNTLCWKMLFYFFFSKTIMGKLGRDPSFFKYVETSVADNILKRTRYACVEMDPSKNPYLQYILYKNYDDVLPFSLRRENFDKIKDNIELLECKRNSLEDFLIKSQTKYGGFNLSDIFEYMSNDSMEKLYRQLLEHAESNAHIVYWNMLVPRSYPVSEKSMVREESMLENQLFGQDKAFFYSALHIEKVIGE